MRQVNRFQNKSKDRKPPDDSKQRPADRTPQRPQHQRRVSSGNQHEDETVIEHLKIPLMLRKMQCMIEHRDHGTFSKNYDRLFAESIAAAFFAEVYQLSREECTLIEAWASVKSFRPKGEDPDGADSNGFKPSNPDVDFKGEKRSNKTHRSRTDRESVLYRKGPYKEAKMCFGLHGVMENRNGLLSDIAVYNPVTTQEPAMALERIESRRHGRVETLGADKRYHTKAFVSGCRKRRTKPHVAEVKNRTTPGLDGRTTGSRGYETSQRIRKQIEEIFGWMKTVGVFRKTRYRGESKVQSEAYFTGATFNLIRMANLELAAT